jgi:SAM-dependent methyltransferase
MSWQCPVCGSTQSERRYAVATQATENGVAPQAFRPSADRFGETVAEVVRCLQCQHGSLAHRPSDQAIEDAYRDATDVVSLDEEDGQVTTAGRALAWVEEHVPQGALVDIGCWTGSFVQAAQSRGWKAIGVEPSRWAVDRATSRGLDVRLGDLFDDSLSEGGFQCVSLCDVLEHLLDPTDAVERTYRLLEPGGALYLTVPDAGSVLARAMGRRWWSVLPMHVQYFTRTSLRRLLQDAGFEVVGMRSHPKVFTVGYYIGRVGGYSAGLARAGFAISGKLGQTDRLIGPDFHDRVQVLARRPATA